MKPLTFFQQGAVAGMQTDIYSTNPGLVDSENLDIFSSSQSVRATAWSEPEQDTIDYVDVDSRGRMHLLKDGTVRDKQTDTIVANHNNYDEHKNRLKNKDGSLTEIEFGEPEKLMVYYDGDERKTIVVFTSNMYYTYYRDPIVFNTDFMAQDIDNTEIIKSGKNLKVKVKDKSKKKIKFRLKPNRILNGLAEIKCNVFGYGDNGTLKITKIVTYSTNVQYNKTSKMFDTKGYISNTQDVNLGQGDNVFEVYSNTYNGLLGEIGFIEIEADIIGDSISLGYDLFLLFYLGKKKEEYSFLPPTDKRIYIKNNNNIFYNISDTNYSMMTSFQGRQELEGEQTPYYLSKINEGFAIQGDYKISSILKNEENTLLFANGYDHGAIFFIGSMEVDNGSTVGMLGKQTFPGIRFFSAIKIRTMIYLIAEERGVSGLYAYYNGDLKKIFGSEEKTDNGVLSDNMFNFRGDIYQWRGSIVVPTVDNRIFVRGDNFGGKTGAFVNEIDGNIIDILPISDTLYVRYEKGGSIFRTAYMNDETIKQYKKKYSATFPVVIGNHLSEKEPKDIEVSYMLPNKKNSLEIRMDVNDYVFWTVYEVNLTQEIEKGAKYYIESTEYDGQPYILEFVEKADDTTLTFRLDGDLPIWTSNPEKIKLIKVEGIGQDEVVGKKFDHFKKIGEIKSDKFKHGVERFTALNHQNNFPQVHTTQIRIVGHTDGKSTSEVYSVYLVNERKNK